MGCYTPREKKKKKNSPYLILFKPDIFYFPDIITENKTSGNPAGDENDSNPNENIMKAISHFSRKREVLSKRKILSSTWSL